MQAPGAPGAPPMWGPGRKLAFGTAPGHLSKIWYTLADGNLSEVFFPAIDRPALHDLRFFASAPGAPPVDDSREAEHRITWLQPGIPAFNVESTHHEYALSRLIVSDPEANALLIAGDFTPELPDVRLFMQAAAHMQPGSEGNFAEVLDTHPPALLMRQGDVWICIVGPFVKATAGYLQSSDVEVDLHDGDGGLTNLFERAGPGNVAVGAELGIVSGPFQIAIGFAHSRLDAEVAARHVLTKGAGKVSKAFERAWMSLTDIPPALVQVSGDGGQLAKASLAVLRSLEDKSHPGAFVAAPCAPWGLTNHDGHHVYHLVWPRDLCRIASALLVAGDPAASLRALQHLEAQQRPDGGWPQNWRLDGSPHWQGTELDQVALPVLLAWRLGMAGVLDRDAYPMVRAAAQYLIREGPATPLDRWEDAGGLSPSTLATCVAALVAASEFAHDAGDHVASAHLRTVADYWNERIEAWCCTPGGQFVRFGSDPDNKPTVGAVAPEFLELVRYGLRRPKDDRILRSLAGVDATLKVSLPGGPAWRRYAGDSYGEHDDGAPWNGIGRGRPWPVLTVERARHFLHMGLPASELARTMESFAGAGSMMPEQLWDAADIPEAGLFTGRATGSAAPLGWSHAEYLELLAMIATRTFPDVVGPARKRYAEGRAPEPAFIWSHSHQIKTLTIGRRVRVQLPRPATVRWTFTDWRTFGEIEATDTTLGLWVAELPTHNLAPGASVSWTAHYATGWEGRNYTLTCSG